MTTKGHAILGSFVIEINMLILLVNLCFAWNYNARPWKLVIVDLDGFIPICVDLRFRIALNFFPTLLI
jgi:hypothetical protein